MALGGELASEWADSVLFPVSLSFGATTHSVRAASDMPTHHVDGEHGQHGLTRQAEEAEEEAEKEAEGEAEQQQDDNEPDAHHARDSSRLAARRCA